MFTIFLLAILFSSWNFNHQIKSETNNAKFESSSLDEYFSLWIEKRNIQEGSTYPLFIVTAEGGASRSAYWTSGVLSNIQQRDPAFINHIFAISSVSGGSLGSATFSLLT